MKFGIVQCLDVFDCPGYNKVKNGTFRVQSPIPSSEKREEHTNS
jgi:hypothetical protein